MKTKLSKKVLSSALIIVMVFLFIPFSINATAETSLPKIDYTPFLIERAGGKTVYNEKTVNMLYSFYRKASNTIPSFADDVHSLDSISFEANGVKYTAGSVYYVHPVFSLFSCGMLVCTLNYNLNGKDMHTMLIAFKGTNSPFDALTDLIAIPADGHHAGFLGTASDHRKLLKENESIRFDTELGEKPISFNEYIKRMKESDQYNMFVTGHSLGGAVANIFTEYYMNKELGNNAHTSLATYTFASPLTCSYEHKDTDNIFNLINRADIVPMLGYSITNDEALSKVLTDKLPPLGIYASIADGYRSGRDLIVGPRPITDELLDFFEHLDKPSIDLENNHAIKNYLEIKNKINKNIHNLSSSFVLYSNYDYTSHTHQTIIYNNGQLIVQGSGKLDGGWSKNTLISWEKVKNKCKSLVFSSDGNITEIGDYAFAGMSQLTNELSLPNSLTKIGNYAFMNCGFKGDLVLPAAIETLGNGVFLNCTNLSSIDARQAKALVWGYGAFSNSVGPHDLYLNIVDSGTDLSKVFKQYNVQDEHGHYYVDVEDANYGNEVLPGDMIYIGRIKDKDLDIRPYYDFHYLLTEGHTDTAQNIEELAKTTLKNIASVDEFGCITISENCEFGDKESIEFTVVIMDNVDGKPDYDIYDSNRFIHFTIINNTDFAGGVGSEERPYLITSADHFDNINKTDDQGNHLYLNKHFKLMNDISFGGGILSPSGALSGGFDGNGYALYGFKVEGKKSALFDRIENGAYVKNLTLGKEGDEYSVTIIADGKSGMKAAALAYTNRGVIENCSVINASVKATASVDWSSESTIRSYAAGLVTDNYGIIENCHVESCTIYAKSTTVEDTSPARCEAYSGGLVALNADGGKIVSSSVKSCTIKGYTKSVDSGWWVGESWGVEQGRGYTYCGGLVARSTSEIAIKDCYVYNNKLDATKKSDKGKAVENIFEADNDSGLQVDNCKNEDHNCTTPVTYISIGSLTSGTSPDNTENDTPIYKTNYYVGEELNLYGLVVRDNNNDIISNYTVEGFDNTTPGIKTITIKYSTGYSSEPLTAEFQVTVHDIVPILVEINAKEENSQYDVNYTITPDDFTAMVYYNNGDVEKIDPINNYSGQWIKFSTFETLLSESTEYVITLEYTYMMNGIEKTEYASTLINAYCDHSTTKLVNNIKATTTSLGYTGDITCTACRDIIEEGEIIDTLYIPGDINNDGKVDNKDTTTLMKYFAGWDVGVNYNALDVNEDGIINSKDTTRLMQYIAGWNAFENTDNFNNEENWINGILYLDNHIIKAKDTVNGELIIKDGTVSIVNNAFENCDNISVIIIPNSVIHIGDYAFSDCSSITDIYYMGTEEEWSNISIGYYNSYLTGVTIHYNFTP